MKQGIINFIPVPIIKLLKKYYAIISYLFFGVCATIINIGIFHIFFNILNFSNIPSNLIAWITAAIFAFFTNKFFVFDDKSTDKSLMIKQAGSFFLARGLTGVLDLIIMFVAIDILHQPGLIWKIISNILVILLNFVASKLFIFKKSKIK